MEEKVREIDVPDGELLYQRKRIFGEPNPSVAELRGNNEFDHNETKTSFTGFGLKDV